MKKSDPQQKWPTISTAMKSRTGKRCFRCSLWKVICLAAIGSSVLFAQRPTITLDSIYNSASYLPSCAPNGAIAQGSIFVIFGDNLGPSTLTVVSRFPLTSSLGGSTVRVTVGGVSLDAYPIYTSAKQIAALLPSKTPVGNGTVTVGFNGQISAPASIRVARSSFGIYTLNQAGTGSAVGQIADGGSMPVSTSELPIRAGQVMVLWGTGLGPVSGDESAGPLPNDPKDIKANVWIGDRQARVTYQGRSGCCAGIDQIVFEVPSGVEGCYVPVAVEAGGVYSNYASISIATQGKTSCSDPLPPQPTYRPGLSYGIINLSEVEYAGVFTQRSISAFFESFATDKKPEDLRDLVNQITPSMPAGSCMIDPPVAFDLTRLLDENAPKDLGLDAGSEIRVTGPNGTRSLKSSQPGSYFFTPQEGYLAAGHYKFENAPGGRNVGPFTVELDYSNPRLLTSLSTIQRNTDLMLNWSTPPNAQGLVTISGASGGSCGDRVISFTCSANISAGQIIIPSRILTQLPPSQGVLEPGSILFSPVLSNGQRFFSAKGLDIGIALIGSAQIRAVYFQ